MQAHDHASHDLVRQLKRSQKLAGLMGQIFSEAV